MSDLIKPADNTPPPSPEVNFALVLSRMIDSVQQDPEQLRQTVYELARIKLREQFGHEDATEINRLVGALESAIQGVESFSKEHGDTARNAILAPPRASDEAPAATDPVADSANAAAQAEIEKALRRPKPPEPPEEPSPPGPFGSVIRLIAVLCVVITISAVALYWPQLRIRWSGAKSTNIAAVETSGTVAAKPESVALEKPVAVPSAPPPFPLPSSFGIYALSDGQLFELKPLPGKVPDQRVAMSAAINTPSQTTIPKGDAKFIVFRRDAATNAPDNAQVRLIAKVARAMGVDASGKAVISRAQDSWVIRNIAFPYKAGPIDEHPEMYLVQPEASDLVLSPGRYLLAIKGQGFDFTVDGAVFDPQHCIERVDAVNGAFYSPCPGK